LNQSNWKSFKYLILRYTHEDRKCGGLADRLKPIPYLIRVAAQQKRVFLIRWDRPAKLEEFLLPNKLDWTVPDLMVVRIEENTVSRGVMISAGEWNNFTSSDADVVVLEGRIQDLFGGAEYYSKAVQDPSETYEAIYHKVFRSLIKASPPIEKMVNDKRLSDMLIIQSDEALNIDKFGKDDQRSQSEFYSEFVDLLITANGKCVSYGKGGFGRFALLLSHNSTCANRHF